jgi:hypothetical protein
MRERDRVLAAVNDTPYLIGEEPIRERWSDDAEIVSVAVGKDGRLLQHASQRLRNDSKVVLRAVGNKGGRALEFASARLREDRVVVEAAVMSDGMALEFAGKFRADREIVESSIESKPRALQFADEALKGDKDIVLFAVRSDGECIQYASENLRVDRDVINLATNKKPLAIRHVPPEYHRKEDVLRLAKMNWKVLRYMQTALAKLAKLDDASFRRLFLVILGGEQEDAGKALEFAGPLRSDKAIVEKAIKSSDVAMKYADFKLRANARFVRHALDINADVLEHATEAVRSNLPTVMHAVEKKASNFQYATDLLKCNQQALLKLSHMFGSSTGDDSVDISTADALDSLKYANMKVLGVLALRTFIKASNLEALDKLNQETKPYPIGDLFTWVGRTLDIQTMSKKHANLVFGSDGKLAETFKTSDIEVPHSNYKTSGDLCIKCDRQLGSTVLEATDIRPIHRRLRNQVVELDYVVYSCCESAVVHWGCMIDHLAENVDDFDYWSCFACKRKWRHVGDLPKRIRTLCDKHPEPPVHGPPRKPREFDPFPRFEPLNYGGKHIRPPEIPGKNAQDQEESSSNSTTIGEAAESTKKRPRTTL